MSRDPRLRHRLPELLVRHRRVVFLLWGLAVVLCVPLARRLGREVTMTGRIPGTGSAHVQRLLAEEFGSPLGRYAVLVIDRVVPRDSAGRAVLRDVVAALDTLPVVTRVVSLLGTPDSLLVGDDGTGALVLVGLVERGATLDDIMRSLRGATRALAPRVAAMAPGVTLRWTGEDPIKLDLRDASAADARRSELRALPLTTILLVVVFGSLVAALLPVTLGATAIPLALGLTTLLATRWPVSPLAANIVTILGLALGIDYALLMVSRYREELRAGTDRVAAAVGAARHAGHTILVAGAVVAVGFAALTLVPLQEFRSVAIGGLLVTIVAVLLATTLLPGLLCVLGTRVGRAGAASATAPAVWRRWGQFVTARPWLTLVLGAAPLVALASQSVRLRTSLPSVDWLPTNTESAAATATLKRMGRGAALQGVRVVLELPPGTNGLAPDGWEATRRLSNALAADPRVARVRSLPVLAGARPLVMVRAFLPDSARRLFLSRDSTRALVEVMPSESADMEAVLALVRELRARDVAALTGVAGARVVVGGSPAFNVDYDDLVDRHFPVVLALVLGGTLVVVLVGFRSLLLPLKTVALNLLTVGACFGALVLVFQEGHGARLLGLAGPLGAVFPVVPLLVFCIVFGISMDYEIFLLARVAAGRREGMDEDGAIVEGLVHTGGVITSAAAMMVVVFGAFALGGFLPTKMLGFALVVAVVLDATLVRLVVGPALLRLAGRWNWWPADRVAHRSRASVRPASELAS